MTDVMKLAIERRSRVMAEIERLKEEANRLNQFIRMGESLVAQANKPGKEPEALPENKPAENGGSKSPAPLAFGSK